MYEKKIGYVTRVEKGQDISFFESFAKVRDFGQKSDVTKNESLVTLIFSTGD